jgi:hypothetical protein
MVSRTLGLGAAVLALGCALGGCNSILGIDRATLITSNDAGDAGAITASYDLTCDNYCGLIRRVCTQAPDGGSDNTEYLSDDTCQSFCQKFEVTGESVTSATPPGPNDTLNCRLWYLNQAITMNDPHDDCPKAGPLGGTVCNGQNPCSTFCRLDLDFCTGDAAAYPSYDECIADCEPDAGYPGFPYITGPDPDDTDLASGYRGASTLNCRIYHLENYFLLGDTTHCAHTSASGGFICVGGLGDQ